MLSLSYVFQSHRSVRRSSSGDAVGQMLAHQVGLSDLHFQSRFPRLFQAVFDYEDGLIDRQRLVEVAQEEGFLRIDIRF